MNQVQNQKYDYLWNYLLNNHSKPFDECSVFDFHKFSLMQNVDYIYFFIADCKRVKYDKDPDAPPQIVTKIETNDYIDNVTAYPFVINQHIPVVTPNFELRNIDRFYALGLLKVPAKYWKENPAYDNYAILLQNLRDHHQEFEMIVFNENIKELRSVFTGATDISTENTDLEPTVLINTHKGTIRNEARDYTSIAFADLDLFNHSHAMQQVYQSDNIYEIPTAEPQDNNIKSGESIRSIINRKTGNAYANNYGRIAHNVYNPYVYNFSDMTWYDWINFINNQYDGGILATEYGKNIARTYETYRMKYINTWNYPSMMFTMIPFTNMPKIVREDPNWNTLATVVDKVKYLKDAGKQIKYNWYNKNTLAYICCEHTRCAMLKHAYPKGLIIRNDGQEICKNCGEVIGNYNDDNAFVEGMDNIDADTTIVYTWRPDQKEEEAKRSWDELSVLVNAVDPTFLSNIPLVNRFIQEYHNKDYYKRFAKYKTSPLKKDKQLFDGFLTIIRNATKSIVESGNKDPSKIDSNNIATIYISAIAKYINNNDVVSAIEAQTHQNIAEISMNVKELTKFYHATNNSDVRNLLIKAITTAQAVQTLTLQCTKFFLYQYGTARRNQRQFIAPIVTNFMRNVFKKSKRFYNMMMVMYTIAKVKSSANNIHDITFDFNDINWSAMFIHTITEGYFIKNTQSKTVLNLSSFNPDDKLGDFYVINLKVNTEDEYYGNISIVNWINNLFATISQTEKQNLQVTMIMSERKIQYNNEALNHQQELINQCYSQLGNDIPLLNNINNIITNKVIDSITCPDVLTRQFDPRMSFKQLLHSKFPSTEEYLADKHNNNIMFDSTNKLFEYYHIDIITWIDKNFINPLTRYIRENRAPSREILETKPSIDIPYQSFNNLLQILQIAKTDYDKLIDKIHLPNECQQRREFIRRLGDNILVNINTIEKLQGDLSLYAVNNRPTPNYTVTYGNLQQVQQPRIDAHARVTRLLIEWYMLCLVADYNDFRFDKPLNERYTSFNILKNSFDNFHTHIFVNKIPYNIIETPVYTFDKLLDRIIDEMFKYNKTSGDMILLFLDNLRINTQLFISPDNYTDAVVKTQRLINRVNNMAEVTMEIQERELQDLDEEERGEGMVQQPVDNPDILTIAGIELEEVTQNEIMGEIENDIEITEDMY